MADESEDVSERAGRMGDGADAVLEGGSGGGCLGGWG
jgi:hypothetical protein